MDDAGWKLSVHAATSGTNGNLPVCMIAVRTRLVEANAVERKGSIRELTAASGVSYTPRSDFPSFLR